MKCPICPGIDLKISERQGIEIDYCPECRGVWLDRGELDKLIERSYTQIAAPVQSVAPYPPGHAQGHYDKHGKPHHDSHGYGQNGHYKKKSWLADLLD